MQYMKIHVATDSTYTKIHLKQDHNWHLRCYNAQAGQQARRYLCQSPGHTCQTAPRTSCRPWSCRSGRARWGRPAGRQSRRPAGGRLAGRGHGRAPCHPDAAAQQVHGAQWGHWEEGPMGDDTRIWEDIRHRPNETDSYQLSHSTVCRLAHCYFIALLRRWSNNVT